jgi:hypothetical protein
METARSSEMLVSYHTIIQSKFDNQDMNLHRCVNLKFRISQYSKVFANIVENKKVTKYVSVNVKTGAGIAQWYSAELGAG